MEGGGEVAPEPAPAPAPQEGGGEVAVAPAPAGEGEVAPAPAPAPAPDPVEVVTPDPTTTELIATQEDGFQNRIFADAEIACKALDSLEKDAAASGLPADEDLVTQLAGRCFLTKLFRLLENQAAKTLQQALCGGATTVDTLFGVNGLLAALDQYNGAIKTNPNAAKPQTGQYIFCKNTFVMNEFDPKENFMSKMIVKLSKSSDAEHDTLDELKDSLKQLAADLDAILPILDKTLVAGTKTTIPAGFLDMNCDPKTDLRCPLEMQNNVLVLPLRQANLQFFAGMGKLVSKNPESRRFSIT